MKKNFLILLFFVSLYLSAKPITVAVFKLKLIGDISPVIGDAITEILSTQLAGIEGISVVERSLLNKVLEEQKFTFSTLFDESTASKVGKLVGAEYVLTGSIIRSDNGYIMNARLINVETGTVKFAESIEIPGDEKITDACKRIAYGLSKQIKKSITPPLQKKENTKKGYYIEIIAITAVSLIIIIAGAIIVF